MKTDIEIAQAAQMEKIGAIAEKIGLKPADLEIYGEFKAKIKSYRPNKNLGKLILVTAMSPTKAGEGKTTSK